MHVVQREREQTINTLTALNISELYLSYTVVSDKYNKKDAFLLKDWLSVFRLKHIFVYI